MLPLDSPVFVEDWSCLSGHLQRLLFLEFPISILVACIHKLSVALRLKCDFFHHLLHFLLNEIVDFSLVKGVLLIGPDLRLRRHPHFILRIDELCCGALAQKCSPFRFAHDPYLARYLIIELVKVPLLLIVGEFLAVLVKCHIVVLLVVDDQLLLKFEADFLAF